MQQGELLVPIGLITHGYDSEPEQVKGVVVDVDASLEGGSLLPSRNSLQSG